MGKKMTLKQGGDYTIPLTFKDSSGQAINITDYKVLFTVKVGDESDEDAVLKKDITSHTDPTAGQSSLVISKEETAAIEVGQYRYDFKIVDSLDKVSPTDDGVFEIENTITDRVS